MLVALPFCSQDMAQAGRLLQWCSELGACKGHDAVLIADAGCQWSACIELLGLAKEVFDHVYIIATERSVQGWPEGANALFLEAAQFAKEQNAPWLFLEGDSVPLRPRWLDTIAAAYGSGFMGHVYDCSQPNLPAQLLSGVAVYPHDAIDLVGSLIKASPNRAFDVLMAPVVLRHTQPTNLIQHFWGKPGLPPIFVEEKRLGMPENTLPLSFIKPEAVLFHRVKDNSLITLIAQKLGLRPKNKNFVVVLNVCNADAELMIKNIAWLRELGGCPKHRAILAYDPSLNGKLLQLLIKSASGVFADFKEFRYPQPRSSNFVHASRWAFLHCAKFIEDSVKAPWLWWESDIWALKPGWIDVLQTAYDRCGKAFMGSIVSGMGHANGTAIYPADCYSRCPSLRNDVPNEAFDTGMRNEIVGKIHDVSHLMQCAWVERGGKLEPHGAGALPGFPTIASVNRILPTAVTFHRAKDCSLQARLREMGRAK